MIATDIRVSSGAAPRGALMDERRKTSMNVIVIKKNKVAQATDIRIKDRDWASRYILFKS